MKQFLFRSRAIRAMIVVGAVVALPVSVASADTTSLFATAQGTSVLGTPVPVLGTQGVTVPLPLSSAAIPQAVQSATDVTVEGSVSVGGVQVVNLYADPYFVK